MQLFQKKEEFDLWKLSKTNVFTLLISSFMIDAEVLHRFKQRFRQIFEMRGDKTILKRLRYKAVATYLLKKYLCISFRCQNNCSMQHVGKFLL